MSSLEPIILEAIENLSDGLSIYDADGRPLLFNSITKKRFPYLFEAFEKGARNAEEAQRYSIRKMLPDAPEEEVEKIADHLGECSRNGTTYEVWTPDKRRVQITFRPMSAGRRVAISVDVTDLRQREKELKKARLAAEQASTAKSAFLANMSHEIRTPLNGILGMAQVLQGADNLTAEQQDQLATILESGRNLTALLNDVLDLSKIEAGRIAIVPADNSLHHTLRRQLRLWRPRAEEKGLELSLSFDADLPAYLSYDAVRVQQCVSNLISNAIKFTEKGRVEIFASAREVEKGSHLVRIRVTDTGVGMDAETLARLFRPFVQADESTSRRFGGTGLGLSITRRLAELMGGEATAESRPGEGSAFTFTFHAANAQSQPGAGEIARPAMGEDAREALKTSNLRILLVDDHPINRQVAALFLRPFNLRIVEAVNGAEALAALKREAFDIVLLDMHMPVMDGPSTIAAIRSSNESWAGVPVIALTADAMSGDRERYLGMGMDGYLAKPLAERDLLTEIMRLRHATPEQLAELRKARSTKAA